MSALNNALAAGTWHTWYTHVACTCVQFTAVCPASITRTAAHKPLSHVRRPYKHNWCHLLGPRCCHKLLHCCMRADHSHMYASATSGDCSTSYRLIICPKEAPVIFHNSWRWWLLSWLEHVVIGHHWICSLHNCDPSANCYLRWSLCQAVDE